MKLSLFIRIFILSPCLFNLTLAAPDSTAAAGKTFPDTNIVVGEKPIFYAVASSQKPDAPSIELIDQASHMKAINLLGERGIAFKKTLVLAIGFETDTVDRTKKQLVIITLDSHNQPQKIVMKTGTEFYRAFFADSTIAAVKAGRKAALQEERLSLPASNRQDGRVYFMLNTTLKSLWVYPANLSLAFPEIDGQVVAGLSLLTLGGSLYGSYLFTKNRELGYGRVEFMNYGSDIGGLYFPSLLGIFLSSVANESTTKVSAWMGMFGYPLGIYLGSRVQFTGNYEYGNASIMTTMSRWGLLYGFLLPQYFDLRENDYLAFASGLSMALLPAGFFIGYKLVGDDHYSSGRSIFIMTTSIMGTVTGALIPTLWESDKPKIFATTALLGQIAGTYIGFNYMKARSYNFGQGLFMAASAIVGGAIAEAPLLIAKLGTDNHEAYTVAGIAGAWGGLALGEYLSRSLFEKTPHDKRQTSSVSFPGVCELPMLFLCKNFYPKRGSLAYDMREPIASARVVEIRF